MTFSSAPFVSGHRGSRISRANGLALCGVIIATSTALAVVATPIGARPRPIVVTATSDVLVHRVSYRDLDLATRAGERLLTRRVKGAVGHLCGEVALPDENVPCRGELWDATRPQIQRAVTRAREIAANGHSATPAVAITIAFPR